MKRTYITIVALLILPTVLRAQEIKPTDFIQLYKYIQLNEPKFGKSAYDYLRTIDTKWLLVGNPTINDKGITVDFAYSKDGKGWFQPECYHLMFSHDYGPPDQRAIVYLFKGLDDWTLYNGQMVLMNATKLSSTSKMGGTQTIYILNDMAFILSDFPPGVNGPDRSYQVSLLHNAQ